MYIARATLALHDHDPDQVRAIVGEGLERMSATDDVRRRPHLLLVALQAEIERATEARARRRPAEEAAAVTAGTEWLAAVQAFMDERSERTDHLAEEGRAFRALGEAEAPGLTGSAEPDGWRAALAAWIALDHPYWIAWCRYRLAEALLGARGPRAEAATELRAAYATAIRLGASPLLASIETLARLARIEMTDDAASGATAPRAERPFGLTARELEVLQQLASGRSNRQIGEALFISESTVGVHVSNILGKLDVQNRVEAVATASRAGITLEVEPVGGTDRV
jgi:DNA-binding CsgD family transcriptional regulator